MKEPHTVLIQIKRDYRMLPEDDHHTIAWRDTVVKPLAAAIGKDLDREVEVLGPFGLMCQVWATFSKNGAVEDTITFVPIDLQDGTTGVIDWKTNMNQYSEGTIGQINRMNYRVVPIVWTIKWFRAFIEGQRVVPA